MSPHPPRSRALSLSLSPSLSLSLTLSNSESVSLSLSPGLCQCQWPPNDSEPGRTSGDSLADFGLQSTTGESVATEGEPQVEWRRLEPTNTDNPRTPRTGHLLTNAELVWPATHVSPYLVSKPPFRHPHHFHSSACALGVADAPFVVPVRVHERLRYTSFRGGVGMWCRHS